MNRLSDGAMMALNFFATHGVDLFEGGYISAELKKIMSTQMDITLRTVERRIAEICKKGFAQRKNVTYVKLSVDSREDLSTGRSFFVQKVCRSNGEIVSESPTDVSEQRPHSNNILVSKELVSENNELEQKEDEYKNTLDGDWGYIDFSELAYSGFGVSQLRQLREKAVLSADEIQLSIDHFSNFLTTEKGKSVKSPKDYLFSILAKGKQYYSPGYQSKNEIIFQKRREEREMSQKLDKIKKEKQEKREEKKILIAFNLWFNALTSADKAYFIKKGDELFKERSYKEILLVDKYRKPETIRTFVYGGGLNGKNGYPVGFKSLEDYHRHIIKECFIKFEYEAHTGCSEADLPDIA